MSSDGVYAPSAPALIWALPGLSDGAKLTLMWWWSRADHELQRAPKSCTVWIPAGAREDGTKMTAAQSVLDDLRRHVHPGKADRTIRGYIIELRDLRLAVVDGRCIDLDPSSRPADEASALVRLRRKSATPRQDPATDWQKSAGENLPTGGRILPDIGKILPRVGENLPPQFNPPIPPVSPQTNQPVLVGLPPDVATPAHSAKPDKIAGAAAIREWWSSVYLPLRQRVFDRWRPATKIRPIECSDDRVKDIRARLKGACGSMPIPDQLAALTHVLERVEEQVDSQRGAVVQTRTGGTYDTMENVAPTYWLRKENFSRLFERPAPKHKQQPRASGDSGSGLFNRITSDYAPVQGRITRGGTSR